MPNNFTHHATRLTSHVLLSPMLNSFTYYAIRLTSHVLLLPMLNTFTHHATRLTSAQGPGGLYQGTGVSLDQLMLRQELRPGLKVMLAMGGSLANMSRRLNPSAGGFVRECGRCL